MRFNDYLIRAAKIAYRKLSGVQFPNPECDCDRQSSNDKIYSLLAKGEPCLISRYGTTEINCVMNYLCVSNNSKNYLRRIVDYITDKTSTPWWDRDHFNIMVKYSGIFPPSEDTAINFSKRYLEDSPLIDLLGCHQYYEKFMPLRDDIVKVQLEMLYPFFVDRPWTRILEGKKVLVIHPFSKTIKNQYAKRREIFANYNILPDFELITYASVQSLGGNCAFSSWFDALKHMEDKIKTIDFDICLLGCGAYGLSLGAYIKRMGKQAVHVGGGLQLMFGIKGKRWESDSYKNSWDYLPGVRININYRSLFNESWTRASADETPQSANKVENACYW